MTKHFILELHLPDGDLGFAVLDVDDDERRQIFELRDFLRKGPNRILEIIVVPGPDAYYAGEPQLVGEDNAKYLDDGFVALSKTRADVAYEGALPLRHHKVVLVVSVAGIYLLLSHDDGNFESALIPYEALVS